MFLLFTHLNEGQNVYFANLVSKPSKSNG